MSVLTELAHTILRVVILFLVACFKNLFPLGPYKSVRNEVILITGTGGGLGRQMAEKFALRHGARIICVGQNVAANQETADKINFNGGRAVVYPCDLVDSEQVASMAQAVKINEGDIDILINNAGVVTGKAFLESTNQMNRQTIAVNTESHFWMVKAFLPAMIAKNHGHIVTIASGAGLVGINKLADYCASKYGAVGFAESLMAELDVCGADGVKTTLVCPYFISTGMFDGVETRFPLILPILTPDYVTDKIIDAVLQDQDVLYMPRVLYLLVFAKGFLPARALQVILRFIGAGEMMTHFVGKNK